MDATSVDRDDGQQSPVCESFESEVRPIAFVPSAQKGRGAIANVRGRYESTCASASTTGGTRSAARTSAARSMTRRPEDRRHRRACEEHPVAQRLARHPVSRVAQSVSRLRTWLHLLLRETTHSYLGLSPGLDFESRLFAKVNAAELLKKELARPSYVPDVIAVGVNTDAYQPIERDLRITRDVLQVLHDTRSAFE